MTQAQIGRTVENLVRDTRSALLLEIEWVRSAIPVTETEALEITARVLAALKGENDAALVQARERR